MKRFKTDAKSGRNVLTGIRKQPLMKKPMGNRPRAPVLIATLFLLMAGGGLWSQNEFDDSVQHIRMRILLEDHAIAGEARMQPSYYHDGETFVRPWGDDVAEMVTAKLYAAPGDDQPLFSEDVLVREDGWLLWELPSRFRGSHYVGVGHKLHETLVSARALDLDGSSGQVWDFTASDRNSHGRLAVALPGDRPGDPTFYGAASIYRRSGDPPPPPGGTSLNVRVMLQGYHGHSQSGNSDPLIQAHEDKGGGIIEPRWIEPISDRLHITLHDHNDYETILYTQETFLMTNGWARIHFPSDLNAVVWVSVRHRNHLETVYVTTLDFSGFFTEVTNISFTENLTTSALLDNSYGSNQASLSGGYFGIFAGDVDQDGDVTIFDRGAVISALTIGLQGYHPEDLLGNGEVNIFTRGLVIQALTNGYSVITP